jgi:hypothetical protein
MSTLEVAASAPHGRVPSLVALLAHNGSLSLQHSMTANQARQLACQLMVCADAIDPLQILEIDIDAVHRPKKSWRLVFECDGARFNWSGIARDARMAESHARQDLGVEEAAFEPKTARLIECVEAAE